ncbi:uncharacterized protein K460DRAFT_411066 [Cucurbitaria berberidis CBS 394.84]|uniref:Uncharacterized protein n=1 Tax=Cucurbitaria berberidis CBS 394.84 TaxID=1168544 RepID=A0A9P4G7L1_9PLEO|nr:uncharacterized protein K460DRAFT_411066 [Cucurbitaria berberidis CBS 394.84]KAF1840479.1 hypothetical protein K460DRAFT_411066 [Cucurbitaria berberidis CBS 394.84]
MRGSDVAATGDSRQQQRWQLPRGHWALQPNSGLAKVNNATHATKRVQRRLSWHSIAADNGIRRCSADVVFSQPTSEGPTAMVAETPIPRGQFAIARVLRCQLQAFAVPRQGKTTLAFAPGQDDICGSEHAMYLFDCCHWVLVQPIPDHHILHGTPLSPQPSIPAKWPICHQLQGPHRGSNHTCEQLCHPSNSSTRKRRLHPTRTGPSIAQCGPPP